MPAIRIPNEYTVENGIGYIHIKNRKGEELELIVDPETIDMLITEDINLCMANYGYARFRRDGKVTMLHKYLTGTDKTQMVDHIDGNQRNNMRSNLRIVTPRENSRNVNNKSTGEIPIRGLSYAYTKGKKTTQVRMRIRGYETKRFKTLELAIEHMRELGLPTGEENKYDKVR